MSMNLFCVSVVSFFLFFGAMAVPISHVDGEKIRSTHCPATLLPGDYEFEIPWGDKQRSFLVHVPPRYNATFPTSLVVNVHGLTSTGRTFIRQTNWIQKADDEIFLIVHPDGYLRSWNGGDCCQPWPGAEDDVGFLKAMIDYLNTLLCIDNGRVYFTGWSNGGFMTHTFACEAADYVTAIASYAGPVTLPCNPSRPVPALHFHATEDLLVPYNGSFTRESAHGTWQTWGTHNGCGAANRIVLVDGSVTCESYNSCNGVSVGDSTQLCTIAGWSHDYPSEYYNFPDIYAEDLFWSFLSRFSR